MSHEKITTMQTISPQEAARPETGDRHGPADSVATRSKVLQWESVAWVVVGAAWIVSAWPGRLVDWDGVPMAALTGLGVVDAYAQSGLWLELSTNDLEAATERLGAAGIHPRDEIEPIIPGGRTHWVRNPAGIVHLLAAVESEEA
ncbi:MAG: VOC family protein [Acidimicrobiia bacterium]